MNHIQATEVDTKEIGLTSSLSSSSVWSVCGHYISGVSHELDQATLAQLMLESQSKTDPQIIGFSQTHQGGEKHTRE